MQSSIGSRAFQNSRLQKKLKKQADAVLSVAFAAFRDKRYPEVLTLCAQILQDLPNHFDALHLLGVCLINCGRLEEARQTLEFAVAVAPKSADAHCDLGSALFDLKRYDDARVCQEKAIRLKPNFPIALTNLGNTLLHLGRAQQAVELHDHAILLKPDYADAYCNRGMAQLRLGRLREAEQSLDRALTLQPSHLEAMAGKGTVSLEMRHYEAAEASFNRALAVRPNAAKVLAHRGRLHLQLARLAEAEADLEAALAISPTLETALRVKVQVSLLLKKTTQAIAACKTLLEQNPRSEIGLALLGSCFASQGDIASAIQHLDAALEIKPDYEDAITRKIFCLDFLPEADFAIQQEARNYWWQAIGAKIGQRRLPPRDLDPQKRIVVGYVSADFRRHSAGFAFMPVLRHHDHANFKIICYSCSSLQDEITAEFRSMADTWVEAGALSDDELADRIQADQVDVLVDLSGHSSGNRLKMFASKPAPVQVTAWGHATGTGLPTIDYLFADAVTIPQAARPLFAERVYDLPSVITIEPILDLHPSSLPMIRNGFVTFGVFNRIYKISDDALLVWSALMREVRGSKIVIKHGLLDDPLLRDGLIARLVAHGIAEERVICLGSTSREDHLRAFENVDISLDTFPQNGGISTWESLYMGVPVVTKLGTAVASRAAGAIAKAIGLADWVADNDESYVAIGRKFAAMPSHLEALRAGLPARILATPAGNPEAYARCVEAGYRQFWRDYSDRARQAGSGKPA